MSLVANVAAQLIVRRIRRRMGTDERRSDPHLGSGRRAGAAWSPLGMEPWRRSAALSGGGAARDRHRVGRKEGAPALSSDFFTQHPAPFGQTNGGIANAIVGTLLMTAMATAIALPGGVLIAIYNVEFAPPQVAETVRLILNVLAGVPTIVIGIFIYGLLVVGSGQSAIAASVALSIVMLPLVARATEEVLRSSRRTCARGGWRSARPGRAPLSTVILPTAVGGIVTSAIVAVARAAGETAPLLFTTSIFVGTRSTPIRVRRWRRSRS